MLNFDPLDLNPIDNEAFIGIKKNPFVQNAIAFAFLILMTV